MRYFKYYNTNKNANNALKEQYKSLTENEKRTFRKKERLDKFSVIVFCVIFLSCVIPGIFLLESISLPNTWFWKIIAIVVKVIIGFIFLLLAGVVAAVLTKPLWQKVESFNIPSMKKEIFSKACGHLRDHYELKEPYIITKCFAATDKKFQDHDVCIFVVRDELRITADLVHGFLHGERDLGCYAFKRDEIIISKQNDENHLYAELKAGNISFLLGYRAKEYIEKNFIIQ